MASPGLPFVFVCVIFLLVLSLTSYANVPQDAAYWAFDEAINNTASDAIGSKHGALVNNPVWDVAEKKLGASSLKFDGALTPHQYIEIADHVDFDRLPLTITAWFKLDQLPPSGNTSSISRKTHSSAPFYSWDIVILSTGELAFSVVSTGGSVFTASSDNFLTVDNQWHFVVAVINDNKSLSLYIDGILQSATAILPGNVLDSDLSLRIGSGDDMNNALSGNIDDMCFFRNALATVEVVALYNQGTGIPCGNNQSLSLVHSCKDIDITGWPYLIAPTFNAANERDPLPQFPVIEDISQYIPVMPGQDLLKCGFLDVTKPPYNVNNSGDISAATTNTQNINSALNDAREMMFAAYFPGGEYVIDGTLECIQGLAPHPFAQPNAKQVRKKDIEGSCIAIGSRRNGNRPRILLKDNTFNGGSVTPVFYFWSRSYFRISSTNSAPKSGEHQQNISFNQMIVGFDIDLGAGNTQAVGIELDGAQGSGIEDIHVYSTDNNFFAGIRGLAGSGGASHNVSVTGGQYGIDTLGSVAVTASQSSENIPFKGPTPTLSGLTLSGQSQAAIRYKGQETLALVGAKISVPNTSLSKVAIELSDNFSTFGSGATQGYLSMVDSQINFASQSGTQEHIAIKQGGIFKHGVYLRNTFTDFADHITSSDTPGALAGNPTGWRQVHEYATDEIEIVHSGAHAFATPTYEDGVISGESLQSFSDGIQPPADLQSRHQWDESVFPYWDRPGTVNIKLPPYNAKGDFDTDDTAVIQQAIDDGNSVIFFPKGYYRITNTIHLDTDTKLTGVGRTLSILIACVGQTATSCHSGTEPQNGSDFANAATAADPPQPVIESANSKHGTATLAFINIQTPIEVPGAYQLNWRTGRNSIIRNLHTRHRSYLSPYAGQEGLEPTHPEIIFTENGGGKFYTYTRDFRWLNYWEKNKTTFRHVKIQGTTEPLNFYQLNPESHESSSYTKLEIDNASNVSIFGYKDEGLAQAASITNSNNISLYGYGGISYVSMGDGTAALPGTPDLAMFKITDSNNIRITSSIRRNTNTNSDQERSEHSWILENKDGTQFKTAWENNPDTNARHKNDRPILYRRSDNMPPSISSLYSYAPGGIYQIGDTIDIQVNFSEQVNSSGSGTLNLNNGGNCVFTVSESYTGVCSYTVFPGQNTASLTVTSVTGVITDVAGNTLDASVPTGENIDDSTMYTINNDPPTATNLTQAIIYTEGDVSVAFADIAVSDADAGDIISATLTLANPGYGVLTISGSASYATGTGVWNIVDTLANVNAALAAVEFIPLQDNDLDASLTTHVEDAAGTGPVDSTITLSVTAVNDPPLATNQTQSVAYTEGDLSVAINDIVVSDVDTSESITATLTLANPAYGALIISGGGSYDSLTGIWFLTDSLANVNAALAAVAFVPTTENDLDTSITTQIKDTAGAGPADGVIALNVTAVNDAPTATNQVQIIAYNEGDVAVAISDIVVSDIDNGEMITAVLTLVNPGYGALTTSGSALYIPGTGVWSITDSVINVNAALAAVEFIPTVNNDLHTSIATHVEDTTTSGPIDGSIALNVTAINDAPTASNLTQALAYNQGDASVAITDIVVTDVDSNETITTVLTLTNPTYGALSSSSGATYDAITGVWTLIGTVANVNAALAEVAFIPLASNDLYTSVITHIEDAATAGPADGIIALNVTATNIAPTATNLSQVLGYNQGDASVAINDIIVTDADNAELITATLTLVDPAYGVMSISNGATYNASTGIWTLSDSVANVNLALADAAFIPLASNDLNASITTHIEDAAAAGPADGVITLNVSTGANGDVTGDGQVDAGDLVLVQRHIMGLTTLGVNEVARGDLFPPVSGDGLITVSDQLLIIQLIFQ
ncbi:MAG: LamG-like jellyroll fold domain-containing protein [Gammaproteobacteria bacterium]